MRLLQPNPGECVDRQTILHLKCAAGVKKNISVQAWANEINELQTYLEKNWFALAPKTIQNDYDALYKQIAEVNGQLWVLEDKIRSYMDTTETKPSSEAVIEIAFAIPRLNDQRADLVKKMNTLFEIESLEKVYSK